MRIIAEDETGGALELPVEELAALAAEGVYAGSTQVIDQSLLDGVLVTSRRNGIVE